MNRLYVALNAVIGTAFVSGVAWAMCAIFVSHEPSQAVATAVVLKETAHALRNRVHRGQFHTKAEVHRTRVAAATAVAALKALRLNNYDANRAADALVCFLRDESPEPSAFDGAA